MARADNLPRGSLLLTALLCLGGAPGETASKSEPDFWINIAHPGRKQYQAALRKGRELYDSVIRTRVAGRTGTLEEALAAFKQATRHSPEAAEGYYWVGKTASVLDRTKEVVDAFTTVRRLQPDFGDELGISLDLGVAYSKLGRFEEAVQEYNRGERALTAGAARTDVRSTLESNAAESLMAMGRLDEAIQRYQEALALQPGYVLAWWGLGVAYDRDEQVSKAKEAIGRALAADPSMSKLTEDGVFFVPDGEVHYYFALGYQVKGDAPRAKAEWEAFVAKQAKCQWAGRARQHLVDLGAPAPARGKRLAPFPKGQVTSEPESLTAEQSDARHRLQASLYRVRQCYQTELRKHPTLAGLLRLAITVGKDGRPVEVKVVSSTVKRASLHSCVVSAVKAVSLNRPSSGTLKFIFPLEFKPVVQ